MPATETGRQGRTIPAPDWREITSNPDTDLNAIVRENETFKRRTSRSVLIWQAVPGGGIVVIVAGVGVGMNWVVPTDWQVRGRRGAGGAGGAGLPQIVIPTNEGGPAACAAGPPSFVTLTINQSQFSTSGPVRSRPGGRRPTEPVSSCP